MTSIVFYPAAEPTLAAEFIKHKVFPRQAGLEPIVCLLHSRRDFVFQRHQHSMTRFAGERPGMVELMRLRQQRRQRRRSAALAAPASHQRQVA